MRKVNIVVPTYNGIRFLDPLWRALNESIRDIDWVMTLVDDGSRDATDKWAAAHPEVNYVSHGGANLGFSKSCNDGARSVESEWVLFLNNDTEPQPGFLEEMLRATGEMIAPQIVGAKLVFMDGKVIQHAGIRFMASGYPYEFGTGRALHDPECDRAQEVDAVTAACMLVERELFLELGGFDEKFLNGWEDSSFCLTAREHGARIYYCPTAVVRHHHSGSEGRFLHEIENKERFRQLWIHRRKVHVLTPFWMAVAATWRCNYRCRHCDIWRQRAKPDIQPREFCRGVGHDFYSNIVNVAIFGGEPVLMDRELVNLIAVCADRWKGAEIGIVTNGSIPRNQEEIWLTVSRNLTGNFLVRVSVDGPEEVHDKLRGIKGAFADAVETVRIVDGIWPGKAGISVTVYPDTVEHLPYLVELVERMGVTFCLRAGVSGTYFGGKVLGEWTPDKVAFLRRTMEATPKKLKSLDAFTKALPGYLGTGEHRPCSAYRSALVVDTDLQVSVCHNRPPMGHLIDIPSLWGRTAEWCQAGVECLTGQCFEPSCFVDGPYAASAYVD